MLKDDIYILIRRNLEGKIFVQFWAQLTRSSFRNNYDVFCFVFVFVFFFFLNKKVCQFSKFQGMELQTVIYGFFFFSISFRCPLLMRSCIIAMMNLFDLWVKEAGLNLHCKCGRRNY